MRKRSAQAIRLDHNLRTRLRWRLARPYIVGPVVISSLGGIVLVGSTLIGPLLANDSQAASSTTTVIETATTPVTAPTTIPATVPESTTSTLAPIPTVPAPNGLAVVIGIDSAQVTWTPTPGISGWEIELLDAFGSRVNGFPSNTPSASVALPLTGSPYTIRVRSVAAQGASDWSSVGVTAPQATTTTATPATTHERPTDPTVRPTSAPTTPSSSGGGGVLTGRAKVECRGPSIVDFTVTGSGKVSISVTGPASDSASGDGTATVEVSSDVAGVYSVTYTGAGTVSFFSSDSNGACSA